MYRTMRTAALFRGRILFADRVEKIHGYGDHQTRVFDLFVGILPTMLAKIFAVAAHVQRSFDPASGLRPIVEIRIIGHSDRVWKAGVFGARNTADEDRISQERADDVLGLLHANFVSLSFPIDIFVRDGVIVGLLAIPGAYRYRTAMLTRWCAR